MIHRGLLAGAVATCAVSGIGAALVFMTPSAAAVVRPPSAATTAPSTPAASPSLVTVAPVAAVPAAPTTTVLPAPPTHAAPPRTTRKPAPATAKPATVVYTCDVNGPPEFGDPAHPNYITNKACGYVDSQGRQRSHDPWIDGQLQDGCAKGPIPKSQC